MPKILNKNYRQFLEHGFIETIGEDQINRVLDSITHKHKNEARALVIVLYYTGARPSEVLKIRARDILKKDSYIHIRIMPSKGGLPRTAWLSNRLTLAKELYNFAMHNMFPEQFLFFHFKNSYIREHKTKHGVIKEYECNSDLVRYYIKKWFKNVIEDSITPYYLRHNRFSKLSEAGINMQDLRMLKGSRSYSSIEPYLHLSGASARNIARKLK